MRVSQRAYQHFLANEIGGKISKGTAADIIEQLREEFPSRKISPAYVQQVFNRAAAHAQS